MIKFKEKFINALMIVLGSEIVAIGIIGFTNPSKLASGGVSGLAVITYHLFNIKPALGILLFSIPIFLSGVLVFGIEYGVKTLFGNGSLIVCVYLTTLVLGLKGFLPLQNDPMNLLLNSVFGGIVIGIGLALVLKAGANTGGTDTIAQILAHYLHITIGTSLLIVDGSIVLIGSYFFGLSSGLFALITIYTITQVVNYLTINWGTNTAKSVYIISYKMDTIVDRIINDLDLGGTLLEGSGVYSKRKKQVLLTIIPNQKLGKLNKLILEIDPDAFMIITQTHQILGEGFIPIHRGIPKDGIPEQKKIIIKK